MNLAQGRYWRATLVRGEAVGLGLVRESLPEEAQEHRDLRVEIPLSRWNLVARNVLCDRKLLGGVLLDFAQPKEAVSSVIARDRLLSDLQRVVLDATLHLVERGDLMLSVPAPPGD
jgi:hypothetical protein